MSVVTSRDDLVEFTPPGSPRTYTLAPLTYRQRAAFRADMAKEGGAYPSRAQLFGGMRAVVRDLAPANAAELLELLDAAEADDKSEDRDVQARLAALEAQISTQPAYAQLMAARVQYANILPLIAAKHALRGWQGPGLPDFTTEGGFVPEALLNQIPDDELQAVGDKAADLMQPAKAAAGN